MEWKGLRTSDSAAGLAGGMARAGVSRRPARPRSVARPLHGYGWSITSHSLAVLLALGLKSGSPAFPCPPAAMFARLLSIVRLALAAVGAFLLIVTFTPLVPWTALRLSANWTDSDGDVLIVLGGDAITSSGFPRASSSEKRPTGACWPPSMPGGPAISTTCCCAARYRPDRQAPPACLRHPGIRDSLGRPVDQYP